jgi:hypothetical protein
VLAPGWLELEGPHAESTAAGTNAAKNAVARR